MRFLGEQAIFNKVAKHLLKQDEIAHGFAGCQYRAENDDGKILKCAAGCLILDKHYDKGLEGATADCEKVKKVLIKSHVDMNDGNIEDLVLALQNIHDSFRPDKWRERLKEIAGRFDLKFNS